MLTLCHQKMVSSSKIEKSCGVFGNLIQTIINEGFMAFLFILEKEINAADVD